MSKHEWKWNWQQVDGEADCGIFYEEHPGMAYSVCRAPRYATKEQWEATATLICKAVNCHNDLLAACKHLTGFLHKQQARYSTEIQGMPSIEDQLIAEETP